MWKDDRYVPRHDDPPEQLWRYMDLWRLLSLLQNKALYFTRLGTLRAVDPFEGASPSVYRQGEGGREAQDYITNKNRTHRFVSCWHLNDGDSMFMWKLYGGASHGVATQSTVQRVHECLKTDNRIGIHRVQYEEFRTVEPHEEPILEHRGAITKRRSFEAEREVRAILTTGKEPGDGISVDVNLGTLVEAVYLAPQSAPWQEAALRKLLAQYNVSVPVIRSRWDDLR